MAPNSMNQMNNAPNQAGGQVQNQNQTEPSPQTPRSRNIFDDLLEGFEDVFARLIAKDEMLGMKIAFAWVEIFYILNFRLL